MKKIFAIIATLLILVMITPAKAVTLPILPSVEVGIQPTQATALGYFVQLLPAAKVGAIHTLSCTPLTFITIQSEAPELDPPNTDLGDIVNIPGKEATQQDWIYWGIGVFVFLFYEFIAGRLKTEKSYKIFAMLYNLSNRLQKDRSTTGGLFKIKRE